MAVYPWELSIEDGKVSAQLRGDLDISGDLTVSGDSPGSLHAALNTGVHGLLNKYELSDDVLHSHNVEVISSDAAYTKKKTITIDTLHNTPETIRISFDLMSGTFMTNVYGRIYKNGGAVGTERVRNGNDYQEYTEDLSFADGDTLELWTYSSNPGVVDVYIQNFRVKGVVYANTLQDAITDTHVGVITPFEGTNS